jgi:hypothetical protein
MANTKKAKIEQAKQAKQARTKAEVQARLAEIAKQRVCACVCLCVPVCLPVCVHLVCILTDTSSCSFFCTGRKKQASKEGGGGEGRGGGEGGGGGGEHLWWGSLQNIEGCQGTVCTLFFSPM